MAGTFKPEWNARFLSSFDNPAPQELAKSVMARIPGLDARTAYILGVDRVGNHIIAAVSAALHAGIVSLRLVEAVAKGPNMSWKRLWGYWAGILGPESKTSIQEDIQDSLGEATFAEELEALGAESDLQYFTGRNFIDIRVGFTTAVDLETYVIDPNGKAAPGKSSISEGAVIAIEFKSYGKATSFGSNAEAIRAELHVGKSTLGVCALATIQDFANFTARRQVGILKLVSDEGCLFFISTVDKQSLANRAGQVLDEGRRLCDQQNV